MRAATNRTIRAVAVVAAVTAVVVGSFAPMVSAHTEMLQSSPSPTQRTGGTVDFIDLIFSEPISDMNVTVEDPNGVFVEGETLNSDGQLIRYEMPALSEVGRYLVRYSMISADGDPTESVFFFTYHPDASQPLRLGDAEVPKTRFGPSAPVAMTIVLGICLAGLAMMYLSGLERRRALADGAGTSESAREPDD